MSSIKKLPILIFARMNSKRLKGKMLMKIGKKSLIFHIIDRVKKIKNKKNIILATSNKKSDDNLVKEARKKKIKIFRGNLNNVVNRAIDCCEKYNLDSFVRICGDRVFLDYKEVDNAIKKFTQSKKKIDIASNLFEGKIPSGKTIEIISCSALKKIYKKKLTSFDLEHLTTYFYKNKNQFKILKLKKQILFKNLSYSYAIDTVNDYKRIQYIYDKLKNLSVKNNRQILAATKKWYLKKKDRI